jgi:hypothetical protein
MGFKRILELQVGAMEGSDGRERWKGAMEGSDGRER